MFRNIIKIVMHSCTVCCGLRTLRYVARLNYCYLLREESAYSALTGIVVDVALSMRICIHEASRPCA